MAEVDDLELRRARVVGRLLRRHGPCSRCGAGNAALYVDPDHRPADLEALDEPIGIYEEVLGVVRCAACGHGNGFVSYRPTP